MNTMLSDNDRDELTDRVRRLFAFVALGVLVLVVVYALVAPAVDQINAAAAAFGR